MARRHLPALRRAARVVGALIALFVAGAPAAVEVPAARIEPSARGVDAATVTTLASSERTGTAEAPAGLRGALLDAVRDPARREEVTSLAVRLDPPELGTVVVRLSFRGGEVSVSVQAADAQAAAAVEHQRVEVRDALRAEGLDLDAFDVSTGWSGPSSEERQAGGRDRGAARGDARADADDIPRPRPTPAADRGTWL